ncbi:MAG: aminotransferase class V-fold PLP-dependent enzyme [Chloroflexota bacterium]
MPSYKDLFLLDPDVVFLNHGSFGACPRPVFETYQQWQRRLERQPVQFLGRELMGLLQEARQVLAGYVHVEANDLVYVPNATFGVNVVARSLALGPGDEVLATDHEYGACDRTWRFLSRQRGFAYVRQPISLPVESAETIVEQFWQGVTERTRVIFISHITSPTALRLPVEAIGQRARAAGILTLIDGAHAPGQLPLDLTTLGVDFYTGNCHKWLCAPKGAGFLYAAPDRQPLIEPLVVSWGWGEERPFTSGSDFLDYLQWQGTDDPAAYLSVPAAIQFQAEHNWPSVQEECHQLARATMIEIGRLTGLAPLYPADSGLYRQMFTVPLPPGDVDQLKNRLYDEYRVEAPTWEWNGRPYLRVCVQGYNTTADLETLLVGLAAVIGNW